MTIIARTYADLNQALRNRGFYCLPLTGVRITERRGMLIVRLP